MRLWFSNLHWSLKVTATLSSTRICVLWISPLHGVTHVGWTGSTRRLYQPSAPKGCAQHRKIQLEPRGVFQSLNQQCSTADGYYCPLLKLYYSIFLSVALLPASPPWRDGRHSRIKLFMTLASALFCRMKEKYNCDSTLQSWLHQCRTSSLLFQS